MTKHQLGELEELVLTVVGILGPDEAYGNAIVEEIDRQLNRAVNLSSVHVTLYRLEDKGLVTSYYGGATAERGGRRKRYFQMTNAGWSRLNILREQRIKLWNLLPDISS
jgi:PadR family transcriptional regulator PadR